MGIRLNKEKPQIFINKSPVGGVKISSTWPLTKIDERLIKDILKEYKIHNADVLFRGDYDV